MVCWDFAVHGPDFGDLGWHVGDVGCDSGYLFVLGFFLILFVMCLAWL